MRRDALHDLHRCPRGQDCVSYGRRVTCARASAGTRVGPSGTKIGHADLTWTFAGAAAWCLRHNPAGHTRLARLEQNHGRGNALTLLAHRLARAVYDMLTHQTAFDMDKFLHG